MRTGDRRRCCCLLSEGTVAQVQADPKVQAVYLGRTATEKALAAVAAASATHPMVDQKPGNTTEEVGS
ncbi:MAG: hypothetical protein LC808_05465 [Actinobacteria bacterium]|nr:hypothetical protein [Actinomycetota bacterium]